MKRWDTPLGKFDVEVGDLGVSRIAAADGKRLPKLDDELLTSFDAHLRGEPASMRLDLQGINPFKQVTLAKLLEIPFGEVRSYSWVAREIGRPAAIRAVASAVAKNPLPLLIPCHRVIRSDGGLGEYSLVGPELKRKLLAFEGLDLAWIDELTSRGVRFLGDEQQRTFHVRTCRLSPHAKDDGYVELKTSKAAEELLFKPCRRCRPVHVY